ncbi:unnamed protein product [Effrenium voratum]|uniref:Uncharacterized protein n=1 Tax=Effrenium voratum TaxID=2562239 RepID=A0AA36MWD7_9DINO|nr:unnamed protein product [Effrenium voratum]CAJ1428507.1 unnamed protein product [Effrenium voratum]
MSDLGLWTVVGGADKGGIIVRAERELGSSAVARLSTGAVVKGLECHEGRMFYELVQGQGPAKGWVTMSLKGKELLVKGVEESTSEGSTSGSESPNTEDMDVKGEKITADEKEALRLYETKFGEAQEGAHVHTGYNRKSFPWAMPQKVAKETSEELIKATQAFKEKRQRKTRYWDVDSDGEEVTLCSRCFMAIGETAYGDTADGKSTCVHPECMAQVMIEEMQQQEAAFLKEENEKKLKNREEYQIGWVPSTVPCSASLAQRFGLAASGLTSLVWDEVSRSVRVAATLEPSAAVNLEYLALALKVRRQERREPLFSLDPVDPQNMEKTMQTKRYEPEWLAGTSVGDIMFQADYFLKELALGEYTMPVVGMLSVFDWSEALSLHHQPWAGREWFVVKRAEVHMAEDKTLIPFVKMGVEAREQVLTADGLRDTAITSASHPLRRFADAFTRNFDLIAERKSVIFHLRELAKASVMAKFLVDSGAQLDDLWHTVAEEIVSNTAPEPHSEIPQLWNMRGLSRIRLENGKIVDMETGTVSNLHAIYGGVEFGLDRFELAQRHALRPGVPGMAMQQAGLQGMQLGPSGRPMFMPQRFQLTQRGEMPQGVDLDLDKFNLAELESFSKLPACSGAEGSLEARTLLGKAFLKGLNEGYRSMKSEDKELLKDMFNAAMADRTEEGDQFIPPTPNLSYIAKLRNLVNEEKALLKKRKLSFCDRNFAPGNAGLDFPRSWTSGFTVERGFSPAVMQKLKSSLVQLQVDATFQQALLEEVLPTAAPEFHKATEDGVVFRIYRLGSLEVRTTQEPGQAEDLGVVFSTRAVTWNLSEPNVRSVRDEEKIVRGRIYIEAIDAESAKRLDQLWSSKRLDYCHYYVVLETEDQNVILTEKFPDGSTMMAVNPEGVEDRNSLAKLMATVEDCKDMDVTVGKVKLVQINHHCKAAEGASPSLRKRFAKAVFCMLRRQARKTKGLDRRPYTSRKQMTDAKGK